MLELAVIALRLLQYGAASILAGSALFFVYGLPSRGIGSAALRRWPRPLLTCAALVLGASALLGIVAQTAVLAGSISEALKPEALGAVLTGMSIGKAAVARAGFAAAAAVLLLVMPPGRPLWLGAGVFGVLATVTFGWMGHGAATQGSAHLPHLLADCIHALSAAGWVGALAALAFLLREQTQTPAALEIAHGALSRFSTLGIALVATLAITGLVNSWFLAGQDLRAALQSDYGRALVLKLGLFGAMLGLAVIHRFRSVPALGRRLTSCPLPGRQEVGSLRLSVAAEAWLGLSVLAVVAWLGTLPPPGLR